MTKTKKTNRRQDRNVAFKVLYSLCFSPAASKEELQQTFISMPDKPEQTETTFAWELVYGTWKNQEIIDNTLADFSENWRIERIAKVELTLLRLAFFELLFRADIPAKATLNEAIELTKQFGDEKSKHFVNGILDAAIKAIEKGTLTRQGQE